ncbi:MAG: hypothetical protein LIO94_04390 [Clostridiales bacterium]|nr:hypothetical protein [Clostridiales bacterium]
MKAVKKLILPFLFAMLISGMFSATTFAASKTVATIGSKSYTSLQDAVDAVKKGQTIKLQKNVSYSVSAATASGWMTVGSKTYYLGSVLDLDRDTTYTLDLNKHTIKCKGYAYIHLTDGKVTIKNGTITSTKQTDVLDVEKGVKLTTSNLKLKGSIINDGSIVVKSTTINGHLGNYSTGTVTVKSGKIISNTEGEWVQSVSGIYNTGKVTIEKVTILTDNNNYALYNLEGGTMSVKGGVYKTASSDSSKEGELIKNYGKLTISGGTFTTKIQQIIYCSTYAVLTIKGGTFTQKSLGDDEAAISAGQKLTISGGTIKAPGLVISGWKTMTIKGGTIISTKSATAISFGANNGVLKVSGGTIESSGGSFNFDGTFGGTGIDAVVELQRSTMIMTGGTIYGKNVPAVRVPTNCSFTQSGGTLKTGSSDIPTVFDTDYLRSQGISVSETSSWS